MSEQLLDGLQALGASINATSVSYAQASYCFNVTYDDNGNYSQISQFLKKFTEKYKIS